MTGKTNNVVEFLAAYPQTVQDIVLELRRTVLSTMPDAREMLDPSSRIIGYGFGTGYRDLICTIIPSKTGVKLGIARGAELLDHQALLQGAGKLHRYVLLTTPSDVKKRELKPLLGAAVAAWKARNKRDG